MPRLPAVCDHPTPNTPAGNFEVFTRTWAENYILFDQKKVDWAEVVQASQSKVRPETASAELFDVLVGMIEPLHDRHTYIEAPDLQREFSAFRPATDRIMKGNRGEFRSKSCLHCGRLLIVPMGRLLCGSCAGKKCSMAT